MNKIKVLNLYACLGGNRYKWSNCDVTAIELDEDLARLYKERFPTDNVIVCDAHEYLLNHYKEFDFIWSSTPCPSHSRARLDNLEKTKGIRFKKGIYVYSRRTYILYKIR